MKNLNQIRNSFEPYIPIKWSVRFSNNALNILSDTFPARDVKFSGLTYVSKSFQLAPGVSIDVNVMATPTTDVELEFYDNNKREIYSAISKINESLNTGNGGISSDLLLFIDEYDNSLKSIRSWEYIVQLTGESVTMLQQEATAYSAPLKCLIIGANKEV